MSSNNIALGQGTLGKATADGNVAVGSSAGGAVTTGQNNVFIGLDAGDGTQQAPGASNSIAFGKDAFTTRSNQIALGNTQNDEIKFFDQTMFRKAGTLSLFLGGAGNFNASGGANIVVGYTAGASLVNADSNTLIGYESGYNITSGGNNVALGARSLLSATTASDCTAVGAGALNQMVTGVGTTAVGRYSLQTIEEGANNTAIGDAAGRNLHGEQNCLMGYGTMRWGYANSYNVVIGQGALYNAGKAPGTQPEDGGDPGALVRSSGVVTGPHSPSNFNAIVGHLAFESTTGGGHTGLGANAGRTLTGGNDTIFIGRNAGFGSGQKLDASGCVVIGVGAVATRDNEIVIGKSSDTHVTLAGVTITKAQLQALLALVMP
jgi:stage V sporulation protein SpoVS